MNADDQIKTSKFLYRFAWTIEIIAASIALSIAWFQILDAPGSASIAEKYMAALPFIAVMLVELTKIPFSRVFYTVQSFKWKIIFATGLALAMVITFETFALGFERFQSITTREIVELQTKITEQQKSNTEHGTIKKARVVAVPRDVKKPIRCARLLTRLWHCGDWLQEKRLLTAVVLLKIDPIVQCVC